MDRVTTDGVTLEYEVLGTGEPAVFIHGSFIVDSFRPLLAEPAVASRYRLVHYHRRGYMGSNSSDAPPSIADQAADCLTLLRQIGVGRAHVVGHSFGGAVALQLALDAPDVVHSLSLLEPALMVGASAQGYRDALVRDEQRYRTGDAAGTVDAFLQARFGAGYRAMLDRVLPGSFAQAVADAGNTFALDLRALPDWQFSEAEARKITQPVLSVLGSESEALWPRFGEAHRLMLAWFSQSEPFVVPGATHALQMQNPREMAEALADFFRRHPIPTPA